MLFVSFPVPSLPADSMTGNERNPYSKENIFGPVSYPTHDIVSKVTPAVEEINKKSCDGTPPPVVPCKGKHCKPETPCKGKDCKPLTPCEGKDCHSTPACNGKHCNPPSPPSKPPCKGKHCDFPHLPCIGKHCDIDINLPCIGKHCLQLPCIGKHCTEPCKGKHCAPAPPTKTPCKEDKWIHKKKEHKDKHDWEWKPKKGSFFSLAHSSG